MIISLILILGVNWSKDSKKRKRSGYILREARNRHQKDSEIGINKVIEEYL
jgi:hypothetical protein